MNDDARPAGGNEHAVGPDDSQAPLRPRISYWAIASLAASAAIFCPVFTAIGPLLAVRALVETRAHPERTGRGLALAALWLGAGCTVGWIVLLIWWNFNVREALLHGPQSALRSGYMGDHIAFRAEFTGSAQHASNQTIDTFLQETQRRYGLFLSAAQDGSEPAPVQSGGRRVVIPYVLVFDQGPVKADARMLLFARGLRPRIESLTVHDAVRGNLDFP